MNPPPGLCGSFFLDTRRRGVLVSFSSPQGCGKTLEIVMSYSCSDFTQDIWNAFKKARLVKEPRGALTDDCEESAKRIIAALNKLTAPLGPFGVVIEGGVMQAIISDDPRMKQAVAVVIDYDNEGTPESELTPVKQSDGEIAHANVWQETIGPAGIDLAALVKEAA